MLCVKHLPPGLRRWTRGVGGKGMWRDDSFPLLPSASPPAALGCLRRGAPARRSSSPIGPRLPLQTPFSPSPSFGAASPPRPMPSIPPLPSAAPHGGREEKGINLFRSTSHQKRLIRTCNFSGNITVKCHGAVGRRPGEGGQLSPRAPGAASLSICETKAGCV